MNHNTMLKICLPVFIGLSLRGAVLLHPYSGQGKPPMFGDYEAQRHWMEVTVNLPINQWYINSTSNNLEYWGLDYPPITAYHSWLLGKISQLFNSTWTTLVSSRGTESYEHKIFMRYTVLFSDLLVFIPAVLFYFYYAFSSLGIDKKTTLPLFYACLLTLLYPGLILIDHGHFQYNGISLGLFLFALSFFFMNNDYLGSFLFCLSLGYKQMELYHSLPIFCYLFGRCITAPFSTGFMKFVRLSVTVILTLGAIFFPFLTDYKLFSQVIHRLFPWNRGLFEDKVSNFWCVTSVIVKWRSILTQRELTILCASIVLLTCLPSCLFLIARPRKRALLYTLSLCSMSFFLFSYQVHEKSILLVALPVLCLLPICPLPSFLFAISSTLSMWSLFVKDGLALACLCTTCIFLLLGHSIIIRWSTESKSQNVWLTFTVTPFLLLIFTSLVFPPPVLYPDIYPLSFAILSFLQFSMLFIYLNMKLFTDVAD